MGKLTHFKTKEVFEQNKNATSISFVKDANEIYVQNEECQWVSWAVLSANVPEGYSLFYTTEGVFKDSFNDYFVVKEP